MSAQALERGQTLSFSQLSLRDQARGVANEATIGRSENQIRSYLLAVAIRNGLGAKESPSHRKGEVEA